MLLCFKKRKKLDINIIYKISGSFNDVYILRYQDKKFILRISKKNNEYEILNKEKEYNILMNKSNICPLIKNININNNKLSIIMDYYDYNLFEFIKSNKFNNIIIKNIIKNNIINIISIISKKKIILLDLKPSNIVINNDFIVRFIDFDPDFIIVPIMKIKNINQIYSIVMLIILANHLYILNNNFFYDYLACNITIYNYKYIFFIIKYIFSNNYSMFINYFFNSLSKNTHFDSLIKLFIIRSCCFF
jgi:hypothetical protein